jgi:hypothetical protein
MKSPSRLALHLATAGLAVTLVSGGCALMAPNGAYVAPPLGSTFTYETRNTGSFGSGTAKVTSKKAERIWQGKLIPATVSPQQVTLVNADGAWPAILALDDKPMITYEPPIGYPFPLVVGKSSTGSYRMTVHAKSQIIPLVMTWKVEAYEEVTVPAGTFKAFKISSSDNFGTEGVAWFVPELGIQAKVLSTRTAKSPSGPGTRESVLISHTITK